MIPVFSRFALIVLLCGCGLEVVETVQTGKSYIADGEARCYKHGICYTTNMSYTGNMKPAFKMSPHCPGLQKVKFKITPVRTAYSDGTFEDFERRYIIERIGVCK